MNDDAKLTGFDRGNSDRLGFVISSLFYEAISIEELRRWAFDLFTSTEGAPLVLMDLSEFHGLPAHVFEVIGFTPHWPYRESAKRALWGIAYLRGRAPLEPRLSKDQCLRLVVSLPHIRSAFEREFPFIFLPQDLLEPNA